MAFLDLHFIHYSFHSIASYLFSFAFSLRGGMEDTDTTPKKGQNPAKFTFIEIGIGRIREGLGIGLYVGQMACM